MNSIAEPGFNFESSEFYSSPPKLAYGQEVDGRYAMHLPLGRGGSSRVYQSVDKETGSIVALKIPNIQNEDDFDRIVREVHVTSALSDVTDDTVPYIGSGVSEGPDSNFVYLATERMENGTLSDYLEATDSKLALKGLLRIVTPAFRAAAKLHDSSLVYRDLKPNNIFVNENEEGCLGDYGIVSIASADPMLMDEIMEQIYISPQAFLKSLTATNNLVGTPRYMPPEVLTGETGFGKVGDVFGAGEVLYEGIVGQLPFPKMESLEGHIMNMHHYKSIKLDPAINIPTTLRDLTESCMERHPQDRPSDLNEVVKVLESL